MYSVSNIIKNKNYPDWIIKHPIFKDITTYDKIFPKKGLVNGSAPLTTYLGENYLKRFLNDILLEAVKVNRLISRASTSPFNEAVRNFFIKFSDINYLTIKKDNRISISLPEDITDNNGKTIFKRRMSLFALLERIIVSDIGVVDFFDFRSFRDFSRLNIPITSAEVCFSTDPWDIATMSMRGVSTCQSWSGEHRQCLIGSMLDPYVGIIYLSSKGKPTEYGSKMLFRTIVRFAADNKDKYNKISPVLITDYIYPDFFPEIKKIFSDYLSERSGLKVLHAPEIRDEIVGGAYFLPRNKIRSSFSFYSEEERFARPVAIEKSIVPYQNIPIKDKPLDKFGDGLKIAKEDVKCEFVKILTNNISTAGIELDGFTSSKINTLLALKNKNLIFKDQIKISTRTFSNVLFKELDLDQSLDVSSYKLKLYMSYFYRRIPILEEISSQVLQWNGAFSLKKSNSFSKKDFVLIMQQTMQQADYALKAELKSLFAARRVDNRPTSD